ncbi:cAMP-binding proteins - catabolite gene activator and regulatory subunit of cAMP-dependent protein kinases [hydrothermal vent metagenome]|uniref:cAMP-binding proteins - catabolite gene activator and regulatory subunit of cAMP-dependent protein kinases n=1 Tax=hydrothermal vent metagenome TaxID=652676 RepID=A0A3B0TV17_9ZZZZ
MFIRKVSVFLHATFHTQTAMPLQKPMQNLIKYIKSKISITQKDIDLIETYFIPVDISAQTNILKAGKIERYIYFLSSGIVKGFKNIDGKLIVEHLVDEQNFFSSLDSFISETPAIDYFETITDCKLLKISKPDFDLLREDGNFWSNFFEVVTNEHLSCKMERVRDFQTLTAKERYIKFVNRMPHLALNVSVENIASFLGMEPQSLSRIRKQVTF